MRLISPFNLISSLMSVYTYMYIVKAHQCVWLLFWSMYNIFNIAYCVLYIKITQYFIIMYHCKVGKRHFQTACTSRPWKHFSLNNMGSHSTWAKWRLFWRRSICEYLYVIRWRWMASIKFNSVRSRNIDSCVKNVHCHWE